MSKTVTILAALMAIFLISSLYLGVGNQTISAHQPAYIGFLLYGAISALIALIFGMISRRAALKSNRAPSKVSNFGILTGAVGLLILLIVSIFG